jgi:hypothetical protein
VPIVSSVCRSAPGRGHHQGTVDTTRVSANADVVIQYGAGCCSGRAPAGRHPCAPQALMAQVPESARIRPLLRWQQEPPKMAACRGFMLGSAQRPPGNRQDGHPEHKTAANRQPSDLRDRCTGRQGRSHQSTTNALQIGGIMELGGLEPPTSWVRSTGSSPLARPKSAELAGILGAGRLARSARIVVGSRRLPRSQALLAMSA